MLGIYFLQQWYGLSDPGMKQTKKGNAWYFGMKTHIGTDTQGRVHSVAVTHTAVHDSTVMPDCLPWRISTWPGGSWPSHEGRSVCRLGWGGKNRLAATQTVTNRLSIEYELFVDGSIF